MKNVLRIAIIVMALALAIPGGIVRAGETNSCFVTDPLPGCADNACEEKVCYDSTFGNPACCGQGSSPHGWTQSCVASATYLCSGTATPTRTRTVTATVTVTPNSTATATSSASANSTLTASPTRTLTGTAVTKATMTKPLLITTRR